MHLTPPAAQDNGLNCAMTRSKVHEKLDWQCAPTPTLRTHPNLAGLVSWQCLVPARCARRGQLQRSASDGAAPGSCKS
jgi:hypothetical protein